MTAVLVLLLAEVTAPLGPYARPGVPVPVFTKNETVLVVEGWRYKAEPVTIIHPPFVPCTVRDQNGRELLRLNAPPANQRLIGTRGSGYDSMNGYTKVHIAVESLDKSYWRCLDFLDEVEGEAPIIEEWRRAGGGNVPRTDNVAPGIYDLVGRPEGASAAWPQAKLIVLVSAAVLGLLLWLGAHLGLVALVALLGFGVGLMAPEKRFEAAVAVEVEVVYHLPEATRTRVFRAYTSVGPGAETAAPPADVPLFYRMAGDPWWTAPDRVCRIPVDEMRLFLAEELGAATNGPAEAENGDLPIRKLIDAFRPKQGRWRVVADRRKLAFIPVD